ncbi:Anaerobic dimethyl sulfoxide reductase chain C [Klebsiella pneumoniae]|nr:Anaerobic dimethyl sulfoxide reductase chain C [Klebsiella pneumoniae]CAH5826817.1 Anaerobic dimethyl sulfoxide reductase chain C [Klebsiella pneumoniae]
MGNGWHEWPLMVFTVFGQCVVGGFIVLALALMTGKLSREQEQRVVEQHVRPVGIDGDRVYCLDDAPWLAAAGL